jgi:hypothetical protein
MRSKLGSARKAWSWSSKLGTIAWRHAVRASRLPKQSLLPRAVFMLRPLLALRLWRLSPNSSFA